MKDSLVFKSEAGKKAILDQYDLILSHWPVDNKQIVIPTHLGDTFILSCGNETAPPLVLLHGSSSNSCNSKFKEGWQRDINPPILFPPKNRN
jgi:hypothetical protein